MTNVTLNSFDLSDLEKAIENVIDRKLKDLAPQSSGKEKLELLTRKDTARLLRISLPTLHDWTKTGIIIAHRIGNRVLYKMNEVKDALNQIQAAKEGGSRC